MDLKSNFRELTETAGFLSARINLLNFGLFMIAVSSLSIYFPFPLHEIFVAFTALFFPGFLFFKLIIRKPDAVETFVVSVVLSMGIIVFATFLLTVMLSFPLDKTTITSAAVFSNVIFLGIHFLKGVLSE
jgi:hypothetical protein